MKKTYTTITLVVTFSIAVVVTLFLLQDEPAKNGFVRDKYHTPTKKHGLDLQYNSYYISGLSNTEIFLGNITAPRLSVGCLYDMTEAVKEMVPFSKKNMIDWETARLRIDSPAVYLTEYSTPSFTSTTLLFNSEKYHNLKGLKFDLVQVLSPNSLIVNGYNPVLRQKALQKISTIGAINGEKVYKHELQQNSNFSIDGFLSYNKRAGKIIFTYYYRNQFVCLDTNMNVLFKGKTLDTNTIAKIKPAEYEKDGKKIKTMASPALKVNHSGYSDGGYIYIESALAGDNEDSNKFKEDTTIDVYSIETGAFIYSLFIPKYQGQKLSQFAVKGNILVAIHGRSLVTYQLKQ